MISMALSACGAASEREVVSSQDAPEQTKGAKTESKGNPFEVRGPLHPEPLPDSLPDFAAEPQALPRLPKGVPAAPASCNAYNAKKANCTDKPSLTALDTALAIEQAVERDKALAAIESCFPAGLVRALRADLAPPECGDAIVGTLAGEPQGISGPVHHALVGLALAARLARAARQPPTAKPPFTKQRVIEHVKGPMGAWVREQATAIEDIASRGAKLRGYGKAVVAIEAGMAEMRFVLAAREVPVPEEIAKFPEAAETYYQNLELTLDARKQRGRDAALVGLGELAQQGVIVDPRLARARDMLAQVYGGSIIKTLDALALPPLAKANPSQAEHRLAMRLPSFYAGVLLPKAQDATALRMLLERGLPLAHRIALKNAQLSPEQRVLVARARIEMAKNYWRAVDVDEAVQLLSKKRSAEGDLLLAIALALRGGPVNAADMILRAPEAKLEIGDVRALDSLDGDGLAAYDAALILQLATPPSAKARAWRALADRFRKAAAMNNLDPKLREEANRRARDAVETAASIEHKK